MFKKITTPIILLTIGTSLTPIVWADEFIIDTAENTSNAGNTLDGDDSITVTETGSIVGLGSTIGVSTTGNNNTITNFGEISSALEAAIKATGNDNTIINHGSATGEDAGIEVVGNNNTLTNNNELSGLFSSFYVEGDENSVTNAGEIEMVDQFSTGIYVEGESNTILNSGSILISDDEGETGITVVGNSNSVTNSGAITTYGAESNGTLAYGIAIDGSNNVIANSGTITTNGSKATGIRTIDTTNSIYQNIITNSGTIIAVGDDADGIYALGDSNTITNTGSINVSGENADGIGTGGSLNTVTNSGNITTTGERGYGITSNENNTIINSGNITTSGIRGYGITTYGETSIENSGNISTTGENAYGIYADGDSPTSTNNSTIVNSNSISTTGDSAYGVYSYGSSNALTNNGTIHTTGADADGLYSLGDSNVITNSGTIKSENGYSIYVNGTDSTVNLKNGSVLVGDIYFSSIDTTLNIDASTNIFIQFDGATPTEINVASDTYIVSDNAVYIANLSDYTAQDQALTISSRLLHDAVSNRKTNKDDTWFNVTGALLNNGGDNTFTGYEGELLSATIGRDKIESTSFFAGLSVTQLESDNAFETSTLTLHGGLYGKWNNEDVAIATGVSYTDVTHQQLDNTTSTGTSETTSDYLSVFISPSLTYSALLSDNDSLRLRYTLAYYNAHEYDFGDNELSVDGRLTNNIEARMAWLHNINIDMLTNDISLRYGADLGYTHGGTVDLTLDGNSESTSTPGDETYARAFLSTSYNSGQLDIAYTSNSEFSLVYTHQF